MTNEIKTLIAALLRDQIGQSVTSSLVLGVYIWTPLNAGVIGKLMVAKSVKGSVTNDLPYFNNDRTNCRFFFFIHFLTS